LAARDAANHPQGFKRISSGYRHPEKFGIKVRVSKGPPTAPAFLGLWKLAL